MSDKPEFPPLPEGTPGMVSIDVLERLGLKDQHAQLIEYATKAIPTIAGAEKNAPRSMTLRELLQKLQALDEKSLDMQIYVHPARGGYARTKDVSLLTNTELPIIQTSSNVSAYTIDAATGALTAVHGSPFPAGPGASTVATTAGLTLPVP